MSKTRLDDLTSFMESVGWEFDENGYTFEDNYINFRTADMLRQAIISLIKELVADAKPTHGVMGGEIQRIRNGGRNIAIDEFEQNLLKALEEV